MLNANSELICATCNGCLFDVIQDSCVLDFVNDVNVRSKSKSSRSTKKKTTWKPTCKVFTTVGYKWIPIGQKFTIEGNRCPLTRTTSTNVVHPKNPLPQKVAKKTQTRRNNPEMLKDVNNKSSSSRSKGVEFNVSNNSEPSQNWESNVSTAPSSSLVDFRLSKLFSGQFCDSELEVAFRKHTCYIHDIEGVDLLKGSRGSNLYTLSLEDMMLSAPICLLSKSSKTKSWLWHRRLSHLNFDFITTLAKQELVRGLPKLKFLKEHLCFAYAVGKSKKHILKPKSENSIQEKLYLLHMDLCGPMRIQSINGRKYILVIVDDYSRFTWVKFL
ncbi:retrovirus-related pol polyprotein from transposon TNT 1-94 [Tanacetum coccineum]